VSVDWFTVIAQIVNFVVLLAILKFLLFDRIVAIVDERNQALESEAEAAKRARTEAEAERARAQSTREDIESSREAQIHEAKRAAEERRQSLDAQIRQEAEDKRERFRDTIRDEQREFVSELVRTSAVGVVSATRRALSDLADSEIEDRIARRLCERLRECSEDEREELQRAWFGLDTPLVVRSSWELEDDVADTIASAIRAAMGDASSMKIDFRIADDVTCGFEIVGGGYQLGWSIDSYLSEVAQRVRDVVGEQARG
jgi:F-type H+-transporting ATPase subunit b